MHLIVNDKPETIIFAHLATIAEEVDQVRDRFQRTSANTDTVRYELVCVGRAIATHDALKLRCLASSSWLTSLGFLGLRGLCLSFSLTLDALCIFLLCSEGSNRGNLSDAAKVRLEDTFHANLYMTQSCSCESFFELAVSINVLFGKGIFDICQ